MRKVEVLPTLECEAGYGPDQEADFGTHFSGMSLDLY